jgi:hypothetical protein
LYIGTKRVPALLYTNVIIVKTRESQQPLVAASCKLKGCVRPAAAHALTSPGSSQLAMLPRNGLSSIVYYSRLFAKRYSKLSSIASTKNLLLSYVARHQAKSSSANSTYQHLNRANTQTLCRHNSGNSAPPHRHSRHILSHLPSTSSTLARVGGLDLPRRLCNDTSIFKPATQILSRPYTDMFTTYQAISFLGSYRHQGPPATPSELRETARVGYRPQEGCEDREGWVHGETSNVQKHTMQLPSLQICRNLARALMSNHETPGPLDQNLNGRRGSVWPQLSRCHRSWMCPDCGMTTS